MYNFFIQFSPYFVSGCSFVFHQARVGSSFIYQKVKEQFPDKTPEETVAVESNSITTIQEAVLIDDSSEVSCSDDSEKTIDPVSQEVSESADIVQVESEIQNSEDSLNSAVVAVEEPIKEEVEDSLNTVIAVEKLPVPEDVPVIEENLGMGDREHDDMYSTRSSRS